MFLSVAQTTISDQNILRHSEEKLACSRHSDTRTRAKNYLIASSLVSSRFLTRGDARAHHELLQGRGYANESLAHS